jgi:hypothetical protein
VKPTYRVRYSLKPGPSRPPADVETIDLQVEMDQLPSMLPASAYIMYVEDLAVGENVHWTRWPKSFRPGFGG